MYIRSSSSGELIRTEQYNHNINIFAAFSLAFSYFLSAIFCLSFQSHYHLPLIIVSQYFVHCPSILIPSYPQSNLSSYPTIHHGLCSCYGRRLRHLGHHHGCCSRTCRGQASSPYRHRFHSAWCKGGCSYQWRYAESLFVRCSWQKICKARYVLTGPTIYLVATRADLEFVQSQEISLKMA